MKNGIYGGIQWNRTGHRLTKEQWAVLTKRAPKPYPHRRKKLRRGEGTSLARRFPTAAQHWSRAEAAS